MRILATLAMACLPLMAHAQTDDRDYLTALLEDNLSGAGRQVVITGFEGALSSQARLAELTIADDLGIWISLKDVVLDWTRSDLLVGKVTVNTLKAAEVNLIRMPQSGNDISAEAAPFSLPDLPVSVSIGAISADTLRLGAPVLGQAVTASVFGSMQIAGGEGQGVLRIERLDANAATGRADVQVSFANLTRQLEILVDIREGQGGILAGVMGIAGAPSLEFAAKGSGPLGDFAAQVDLRSDGTQRLGGSVTLTRPDDGRTAFSVDLSGDLSPLVDPIYRPFFGAQTALTAKGTTRAAGGLDMDTLSITSQSMQISGNLSVAASGVPSRFDLNGAVQSRDGAPIVLPFALNAPAAISSAKLQASFDAAKGDSWQVDADLAGWSQADLRVAAVQIAGNGTLRDTGTGAQMKGEISLNAEGVLPARASLSRALGSVIWGNGGLSYEAGALTLSNMVLNGEDYQISLNGRLDNLAQGLNYTGEMAASATNLARFAGLLGHPVAGAGALRYQGSAVLLTGAFDGQLQASTENLALGIKALDAVTAGKTAINLQASRGAQGIQIAALTARAKGASLDASGQIARGNVALTGEFSLPNMPAAQRGFGGQVAGTVLVNGTVQEAVAQVSARATALNFPNPYLQKLAAADTDFTAEIALINLAPQLRNAAAQSSLLRANISLAAQNGGYDIDFGLTDLGIIVPQFPGPLTLKGSAALQGDGADLNLAVSGAAGLSAQIIGQVSAGQSNNLRLSGRADAGLMNAFIAPRSISGASNFDLTLRGAPALRNVAGSLNIVDARLADPNLTFALRKMVIRVDLAGQTMVVDAKADATSGGGLTVVGTVAPVAPFDADLNISLRDLGLRDPDLYQTTVAGNLNLAGPLMGGARLKGTLDLGRTEVQLRPTDALPAVLPDLQHVGDTPQVRATRARAGFDQRAAAQTSSQPIALDITVRAPNRLFVRGRGLDAELGGEVRLLGTSQDVRPEGAFDLVRGRFDILTKRLDLEQVRLEMQGQLIPYLSLRATNLRAGVTTTVIIDGPASDPEFTFSAFPEMPQEEVLAELLFDQNLQGLTPLQAVQLTGAIATLSGRGDGLIGRIRRVMSLDNLDIQTDNTGKTSLKLGKYVDDNVYSELSSDSSGTQVLDFTYTLNDKIKLRAGAETSGNTSVGIELEINY